MKDPILVSFQVAFLGWLMLVVSPSCMVDAFSSDYSQHFSTRSLRHPHQKKLLQSYAVSPRQSDYIQVQMNEFFKKPVPTPIKNAFQIFREESDADKLDVEDAVTLLTAAPGSPGVPRPLWLVMLGSIPSGLLWYGYYKFAVEEELLQMELEAGKEPQGFGGYGTLGPFTYGMFLGPLAEILHIPGGINWSAVGVIFIYYTQFLLYDRVNTLIEEEGVMEKPLQIWWCLPIFFPFNLIVGLRQVHFLSQYLYRQRGVVPPPNDLVADFFPFIKEPSLTWQEFLLTPSLWCSLLSDVEAIDAKSLPGPVQELMKVEQDKQQ
ncbi:hypothetical protein IV203_007982 [Nitzschia inconspicua]|uniref:Uncharacterized protein n=1 Tax=Nitzschia inconspicua TaxID=303405 RepID=A0A9K3KXN5_9STRA|nr:hypothetical protein IV203_007982 [Nitzschia inconspicua]